MTENDQQFVSRGGLKLEKAVNHYAISLEGRTTADLGSNVGGFVDCQLQNGASKVYSIDTSYGTLAWKLRQDPRVEVVERTNALHWSPEEDVSFVSIDVGWTPQDKILPVVWDYLADGGEIVSLLKPQYESDDSERHKGRVKPECLQTVVDRCVEKINAMNYGEVQITESPIEGGKGNTEYLVYLKKG